MADGAFGTVAVEVSGHVGTITLNRPDKLNALTVEMVRELTEAVSMLAGSAQVRCIVLTGAGRAFCAGADLGVLQDIKDRNDQAAGAAIVDGCRTLYRMMRGARQPVICALNGAAAGGGANIALACDLRMAADTASIGQVFAKLGLHPDYGGSFFVPRLVGPSRAIDIFLEAEMIPAPRLLELGLVNRVVAAGELPAAVASWAEKIAAAPPVAVALMKESVYLSESSSLETMLDRELKAQLACFATADFTEGLAAFKGKRAPKFTGR